MKFTASKVASKLKRSGYKLTPQRHAILKVIAQSHSHLTPAAIHKMVRQEHPGIGLVTIYRTLEVLSQLGLICRVYTQGEQSYLLRRPLEHHHHLVCSSCGKVIDFTHCNLSELERKLSEETGFKVEGHLLEVMGLCKKCQKV